MDFMSGAGQEQAVAAYLEGLKSGLSTTKMTAANRKGQPYGDYLVATTIPTTSLMADNVTTTTIQGVSGLSTPSGVSSAAFFTVPSGSSTAPFWTVPAWGNKKMTITSGSQSGTVDIPADITLAKAAAFSSA